MRLSDLIETGTSTTQKTPLILVHGVHGTGSQEYVHIQNQYWRKFIDVFKADPVLRDKYALYVFQYHSDMETVQEIGCALGSYIDQKIPGRAPVILAHSMGGLVAKAYMVYYTHRSPVWAGKKGGDVIKGCITLATPHHGTHAANDTDALKKQIGFGWKTVLSAINFFYWRENTGEFLSPQFLSSGNPNRGDLRWDNFDKAIGSNNLTNNDVNVWLPNANAKFSAYSSKSILYAGTALYKNVARTPILASIETVGTTLYNDHLKLSYANDLLINGYSNAFGHTDGLVPSKSALLCETPPYLTAANTPNFVCVGKYRVRRFEAGSHDALANERPDKNTLSIKRRPDGYDHLDMFEHMDVLRYVVSDLKGFLSSGSTMPAQASIPETPTMFLLDISGSMLEDNKIDAAKESGLNALREIGENRKKKQDNSTIAISTFGGECDTRSVRQILSYTPNLSQAENIFKNRIPRPDGATPLYTAIDLTVDQMLAYLKARPNLREGRILLLSDGQNTCGDQVRPRGVYSQSSQIVYQQVRFLTVGFSIQPGSQAERDLQYLASASNGKYYPARDNEQLSRVFEKAVCVYIPKQSAGAGGADFQRGMDAIASRNFEEAIRIFTIYVRANPSDSAGYYNLALACEAAERYRQAVENYLKCLQFALDASEKIEIEERIEQLEEDAVDEKEYYLDLLRSDLDYLTRLHSRLFELKNAELAAEFAGFVAEKGGFYRSIPQILEIRDVRIDRNCGELGDSLDYLNRRVGLESFDRDAVSLLAPPIGYLRELIRRIEGHNITIRR